MLTQITDFADRTTTLAYNGGGQLISIAQPDPGDGSPVTHFGYDTATGMLDSMTDADGNETDYVYDSAGTLHTIRQPDGSELHYTALQAAALPSVATESSPAALVDVATVHASSWDQLNHLTQYTFDRFGQPTSITDAENHVTTITRDDNALATQIVQANPGDGSPTTTYVYDSRGDLTEETLPDGSQKVWTYQTFDSLGGPLDQITSYTDKVLLAAPLCESSNLLSYPTIYTIDPATGDVLSVRQVVGQVDGQGNSETDDVVTGYTYTQHSTNSADPPAGLVLSQIDPLGHVTQYQYNANGLLTQTAYALGTSDQAAVQDAYDSAGDLVTATDALGNQTAYTYDTLGRETSMTQPADNQGQHPITHYLYDALGNLVQETDPLNRVTSWTYNDRGELCQITKPSPDGGTIPNVTTLTYTATGQLYTEMNPLGGVTTYAYDALGQETSVAGPAPDPVNDANVQPLTSFTYDALGRVTEQTDPRNNATYYAYSYWGDCVTTTPPPPAADQWTPHNQSYYDSNGLLRGTLDALNFSVSFAYSPTTYQYDALGRAAQVQTTANGPLLGPTYDKDGNVVTDTDALGNVTHYAYDARNRLITKTLASPDGNPDHCAGLPLRLQRGRRTGLHDRCPGQRHHGQLRCLGAARQHEPARPDDGPGRWPDHHLQLRPGWKPTEHDRSAWPYHELHLRRA